MKRLGLALVALFLAVAPLGATERIKDITTVQGLRDNQLVGYGLVIGLSGTGDSLRNAPFTEQSMRSMLQRMGVDQLRGADGPAQTGLASRAGGRLLHKLVRLMCALVG